MPPALAVALTILFIGWLLRADAKRAETRSPALWLPVFWLAITGSRFVSQWMSLGEKPSSDYADGSTIDALYFLALILLGFWVLIQRRLLLGELILNNKWLLLFLAYSFVSIAWSEFPFIAFKRWIKTLGHPLMVLIILTDPDPVAALRTVLKRCAFFLLPGSVLFIKYLPEYGRGFDQWTGEAFNHGVGLTKNDLGYVCMVTGIFFVWNMLTAKRDAEGKPPYYELALSLTFIGMAIWLLLMSQSATSLATMTLGIGTVLALGWRIVSKRFFGTYVVVVLLLAWSLETNFKVYEEVLELLEKDASLTDRTEIWADVLAMQDRPWLGFGFESFWLGERLDTLWEKWWWKPNQAHNGLIETYLNLGGIGVALMICVLLSAFRSMSRQLQTDLGFARLRFAYLFAIIAFNYTEAAFKGVHFVWTIFFLVALNYPKRERVAEQAIDQPATAPDEQPAVLPVPYQPVTARYARAIEEPAAQPTAGPVEQPIEQPMELPIELPMEQPMEQHIDQAAETLSEQAAETLSARTVERPIEQPDGAASRGTVAEVVDTVVPADRPVAAENPLNTPARKSAKKSRIKGRQKTTSRSPDENIVQKTVKEHRRKTCRSTRSGKKAAAD